MPSEHIPYGKWAISLISVTYNNYRISLIVLTPSIHIPHGKWAISLISLIYNFRISLFVLMPSAHVFIETELKSSLVWTLNPLNFDVGYSGRGARQAHVHCQWCNVMSDYEWTTKWPPYTARSFYMSS